MPDVPITPIWPLRVAATASAHTRFDHADDRHVEVVAQFVECNRRGGVAGDDDHLHVFDLDEVIRDLVAEPPDLLGRTRPVRMAPCVTHIHDFFVMQEIDQRVRDGEAAKTAVEDANGSVIHLPNPD